MGRWGTEEETVAGHRRSTPRTKDEIRAKGLHSLICHQQANGQSPEPPKVAALCLSKRSLIWYS